MDITEDWARSAEPGAKINKVCGKWKGDEPDILWAASTKNGESEYRSDSEEMERLYKRHEELVKKKFSEGLTSKESNERRLIQWGIDRTQGAERGEVLDWYEKIVEAQEVVAKDADKLASALDCNEDEGEIVPQKIEKYPDYSNGESIISLLKSMRGCVEYAGHEKFWEDLGVFNKKIRDAHSTDDMPLDGMFWTAYTMAETPSDPRPNAPQAVYAPEPELAICRACAVLYSRGITIEEIEEHCNF